jgi:flagellar hook assembly protein FlgD
MSARTIMAAEQAVPLPAGGQDKGRRLYSFPNPVETATTIAFTLEVPAPVALRVHDAAGRLVRTLLVGGLAAGEHRITWDGRDQNGASAPAGTCVLDLHAGDLRVAGKVLVLSGK